MSAPMRLVGKWLSRAEIPANWQRGCGLVPPLFCSSLILEWSVCQGDTLALASMSCLFPALEDRSAGFLRQITSTFQNCLLCTFFRKMERNHLKGFSSLSVSIVMCNICELSSWSLELCWVHHLIQWVPHFPLGQMNWHRALRTYCDCLWYYKEELA